MLRSAATRALLVSVLLATAATAQSVRPLDGIWRQDDGAVTVRIAPCAQAATVCATVIEHRLEPGEPSMLNQTVVRDMRPDGNRRWRGRYVVDGQSMNATARLTGTDALSLRVCAIAFLCDTVRFNRVR